VRAARDAGFDLIVMGQHFLSTPFQEMQSLPALARLAAEAGTMRVGATVILLPLLNPVDVAEQVATLDVITEGRFIFGVGLGYREEENEAFGIAPKERVGRLVESLEVITRLWSGEEVTHHGRFFHLTRARMMLRPVQRPHPPIWFAANNDAAVVRAARLGSAWVINPHAKLAVLERQMDVYRQALQEAGRPFPVELPIIKELYVAPDRRTALRECQPFLEAKYKAYASWGQDAVMPGGETFHQPFESLLRDRFVLGSPEECYEQLRPCWEKVGATALVLRTHWIDMPAAQALDSMRLISDELLPALHRVRTAG